MIKMENNNNSSNKQNKPNSGHGGRHRYNHRRRPKPAAPKEQQAEQSAVQTEQAAHPAEAAAPSNYQPRHNHGKKNHRSNNQKRQNTDRAPENESKAASEMASSRPSAGRPARYPGASELLSEAPPEVIFIDEPDTATPEVSDLGVKTGDPDMSYFDLEIKCGCPDSLSDDPTAVEVVGVRFRRSGKVYYFDPHGIKLEKGAFVIVETARGPEYGEVWMPNRHVTEQSIVQPLRHIVRIATEADAAHHENNRLREKEAFDICQEKITKHGLEMKLVEAQYTFDNSKLLFYFTSAGRVDFRELVKDLASVFRTRIELRQIGIRDEAKLLGGLGACGRALCSSGFLADFAQVSIKMAKEQNLSLNSNKISGTCGRLMCCLRYENDTYEQEIRKTPPVDSVVKTPDGNGTVTEINPLAGMVKVRITDKQDNVTVKAYHRDLVTVLSRPKADDAEENAEKQK